MTNPYVGLPKKNFWKHGVRSTRVFNIEDLYKKKFDIYPGDKIATAGSCFAQHIAKRLMQSGYDFLDVEKPPSLLAEDKWKEFGYNVYSARYSNIYTSRQLLQLVKEVVGEIEVVKEPWEKNGKLYDPLRPSVEPFGFDSHAEYLTSRYHHLASVRSLFEKMDVFIFTMGLTEYWYYKKFDRALPVAPGVVAGEYFPEDYSFQNMSYVDVVNDFKEFISYVDGVRSGRPCKYILTVSPVPLSATAEDEHVLTSTTYSKSVLRAAAGDLAKEFEFVDYFPSYEIIASPWFGGIFYDIDQRNVMDVGVDTVMRVFFDQHPPIINSHSARKKAASISLSENSDVDSAVCEEALIEGFSK